MQALKLLNVVLDLFPNQGQFHASPACQALILPLGQRVVSYAHLVLTQTKLEHLSAQFAQLELSHTSLEQMHARVALSESIPSLGHPFAKFASQEVTRTNQEKPHANYVLLESTQPYQKLLNAKPVPSIHSPQKAQHNARS